MSSFLSKSTIFLMLTTLFAFVSQAQAQSIQSSDTARADWCAEACFGTVIEKGTLNAKGLKHGKWIGRYQSTKDMAMQGTYFNGKKVGVWRYYYLKKYSDSADARVTQGAYKNGYKSKTWTSWNVDGRKYKSCAYTKKGLSRQCVQFDKKGIKNKTYGDIFTTITKRSGKTSTRWVRHGAYDAKTYYGGREFGQYRKGQKHGLWKVVHKNQNVINENNYVNGTFVGKQIKRYINGKIACVSNFTKTTGKKTCYFENKKIQQSMSYVANKKSYHGFARHGLSQRWFSNGQLASKVNFVRGERIGKYTTWHNNGNKAIEGTYTRQARTYNPKIIEAQQSGIWTSYYQDGKRKSQGERRGGYKIGTWKHWKKTGEKDQLKIYSGKKMKPSKVTSWR